MSTKNNLEMMEVFMQIAQKKLTPNQFYLMCCIRESVASQYINLHAEIRSLVKDSWIKDLTDATGIKYELSSQANAFLEDIDGHFKVNKKKVNKSVMGDDYQKNIDEYILLFPKLRLPSGKAARSDKKNVQTALEWFIKTYEYSWETILKATAMYVDEYERKNYMYMQTSQYFIRKQQSDKSWGSELANMCAVVESGDIQQDQNYFSESVV
jgi:hypothetical protein